MNKTKLIFFDGVDRSGKSYKLDYLLESNPIRYSKFRSNYQFGSSFCGEHVNLEESLKHDWRILHDFIIQIDFNCEYLLIDRGFISSYVYSKVCRKTDLTKYLDQYFNMFKDFSEFWFFFRHDEMKELHADINNEFKNVWNKFNAVEGVTCKKFDRYPNNKFLTDSFLDAEEEINSGRIDINYYYQKIYHIFSPYRSDINIDSNELVKIIVMDLDGTIIDNNYPKQKWSNIKYGLINDLRNRHLSKNTYFIVITGRNMLEDKYEKILRQIFGSNFSIILNNYNLGLSSRVLKTVCLRYIVSISSDLFEKRILEYYDDREDVMKYLFDGIQYEKIKKHEVFFATS